MMHCLLSQIASLVAKPWKIQLEDLATWHLLWGGGDAGQWDQFLSTHFPCWFWGEGLANRLEDGSDGIMSGASSVLDYSHIPQLHQRSIKLGTTTFYPGAGVEPYFFFTSKCWRRMLGGETALLLPWLDWPSRSGPSNSPLFDLRSGDPRAMAPGGGVWV